MEHQNIDLYWDHYRDIYSFEGILSRYRQAKVQTFLREGHFRNILEIGCGFSPGFLAYGDFDSYVIVEPGREAFLAAQSAASEDGRVIAINSFLEPALEKLRDFSFDAVLLPGVLHEVDSPDSFLQSVGDLMSSRTQTYVNVPNANSLHRLIAVEAGITATSIEPTSRNLSLGQVSIFTMAALKDLILESVPGSSIAASGTFFLKPFTHDQMMTMVRHEIIDDVVLEGLSKISRLLPDFGSEMFVVFTRNGLR